MSDGTFIAAGMTDDQIFKLIFGAIVFVVFIVGSLLKALTMAKPQADANADPAKPTRMVWDEILGGVREVIDNARAQSGQARSPQSPPSAKANKKRRTSPSVPPSMPQTAAAAADESEIITARVQGVSAPSIVQRAGPSRAAAMARSINARTLRDQYILTEILAKPLVLRE